MPRTNKMLSVILLSYFSSSRLDSVSKEILDYMDNENIPVELIIMDDGSKDDSPEIARKLAKKNPRIKAYQLSRNYTTNYSKFAGLSVCEGGCAVFVPDDLQRPLDLVVKMYRLWEQGHQLIVDYRSSRDDGMINDFFSNMYYSIMNAFSDVTFPPGGADGFLADREVIDIINTKIHPINTSIMVEALRLGFDPVFIPHPRPKTDGKSRWTFKKKWRLATDTFFTSSSFPIKLISYLGLMSFVFSLIMIPIVAYAKFFLDDKLFGFSIPGWTSTIIIITFFSGLILFCMGILAEYIWRIFEEVKGRPGFIIRKNPEEE